MNLSTAIAKRWKAGLGQAIAFSLVGGIVTPGTLPADTLWGTQASGIARQFEITCGTCPNPVTDLSRQSDGGVGQRLASVEFSSGSDVTYEARAIFRGLDALPRLAVLASADIRVEASPTNPQTFFYSATATARSTQQYTYVGSDPSNYTLEYNLNGQVSGGNLTEIAGGFTVFGAGFDPQREIQPVLGFTSNHVNGDGTEKQVHLLGDVTFTVNPGDTFFVQGTLDTFVDSRSQQLTAFADAFHTFDMQFTEGNTSLLIPAAAATPDTDVPEPAAFVLVGASVAGSMVLRWRRCSEGKTIS